ncbi:MAG: hypothetical protein JW849_09810 [Phycisphaerae bacterium]|nr:hypothetical protein [Phycisphaerae bacterium]
MIRLLDAILDIIIHPLALLYTKGRVFLLILASYGIFVGLCASYGYAFKLYGWLGILGNTACLPVTIIATPVLIITNTEFSNNIEIFSQSVAALLFMLLFVYCYAAYRIKRYMKKDSQ